MSEWQPARFILVHKRKVGIRPKVQARGFEQAQRRIISVRPTSPSDKERKEYLEIGCDAERFYELRFSDIADIEGAHAKLTLVCEHEVLTD